MFQLVMNDVLAAVSMSNTDVVRFYSCQICAAVCSNVLLLKVMTLLYSKIRITEYLK